MATDVQTAVVETASDSGILQPVGDAKGILQIKKFLSDFKFIFRNTYMIKVITYTYMIYF